MPFKLENVVPWGRNYDEYIDLFALNADNLQRRILGCGDGPAAFNAELTRRGGSIVSVDPVYHFTGEEIRSRIDIAHDEILAQLKANPDQFLWTRFHSPEHLCAERLRAMEVFLDDSDDGLAEGRYRAAELPELPFADGQFDLALCSHLLFLYGHQLGLEFHHRAVAELCRVAGEVRVFPLLDLAAEPSPFVEPVMERLRAEGFQVQRRAVNYQLQKGGKEMLVIK